MVFSVPIIVIKLVCTEFLDIIQCDSTHRMSSHEDTLEKGHFDLVHTYPQYSMPYDRLHHSRY